jgi:hypothetical protein
LGLSGRITNYDLWYKSGETEKFRAKKLGQTMYGTVSFRTDYKVKIVQEDKNRHVELVRVKKGSKSPKPAAKRERPVRLLSPAPSSTISGQNRRFTINVREYQESDWPLEEFLCLEVEEDRMKKGEKVKVCKELWVERVCREMKVKVWYVNVLEKEAEVISRLRLTIETVSVPKYGSSEITAEHKLMSVWLEVEAGHPGTMEDEPNHESILSEMDVKGNKATPFNPSVSPSFGNLETALFQSKRVDPIQIIGNDEKQEEAEDRPKSRGNQDGGDKKGVPDLLKTPMTFKDYRNQAVSVTDLVGVERDQTGGFELQQSRSINYKKTNEFQHEVRNLEIPPIDSKIIDEFEDVPTVKDKPSQDDPFSQLKSKEAESFSVGSKKEEKEIKGFGEGLPPGEMADGEKEGQAQAVKVKESVEDSSDSDF